MCFSENEPIAGGNWGLPSYSFLWTFWSRQKDAYPSTSQRSVWRRSREGVLRLGLALLATISEATASLFKSMAWSKHQTLLHIQVWIKLTQRSECWFSFTAHLQLKVECKPWKIELPSRTLEVEFTTVSFALQNWLLFNSVILVVSSHISVNNLRCTPD